MKSLASLAALCAFAAPAQAMSVVSLHGGITGVANSPVDLTLMMLSALALTAVIALRLRRRPAVQK